MTAPRPQALSALHHVHLALGAEMGESYGWLRPVRYSTPDEECEAVRGGVGLCDTSPSGKLLLHGEIDRYVMEGLQQGGPEEPGDAGLMQFTEDSGIGDILAARLAADEALLVTAPNQSPMVAETLGSMADACAHSVDVTSARTGHLRRGPGGAANPCGSYRDRHFAPQLPGHELRPGKPFRRSTPPSYAMTWAICRATTSTWTALTASTCGRP